MLVSKNRGEGTALNLYFQGQRKTGKKRTAEALAGGAGMRLLVLDLPLAFHAAADFEELVRVLFREARLQNAIVYIDDFDILRGEEQSIHLRQLLNFLNDHSGITILAGALPCIPDGLARPGLIPVSFAFADVSCRQACWEANLAREGLTLSRADVSALAGRFQVTPRQIEDAVACARNQARWRTAAESVDPAGGGTVNQPSIHEMFAAARAQSGSQLDSLAQKVATQNSWEDIVLPEDAVAQLREICQRVLCRWRVMHDWGFDRKLSTGRGVSTLFAGPAGTGKTMAAEVVANELGLDLYKIDLSGVVSKYIGETEKNLSRIFAAAENTNGILFFDEADALFGKRSEVRDSDDRYANIEILYLLQRMEQYEGVAILATNLRSNLDEAFVRRLAFTVHFPLPDEGSRRRLWARVIPAATPVAADVDFDLLAAQFKLSGGNIRNIAIAASFLAAADGDLVTMAHVLQATRREYQKMGKTLSQAELYGGLA